LNEKKKNTSTVAVVEDQRSMSGEELPPPVDDDEEEEQVIQLPEKESLRDTTRTTYLEPQTFEGSTRDEILRKVSNMLRFKDGVYTVSIDGTHDSKTPQREKKSSLLDRKRYRR
jgi:hypothetical protein